MSDKTESWTCAHCAYINDKNESCHACGTARHYRRKPSILADFDVAISNITAARGETYGHPADDLAKVAKMVEALPQYSDPRLAHIAHMICVKLARLAATPDHLDSLIDIAGYTRCWVMILDREPIKSAPTDPIVNSPDHPDTIWLDGVKWERQCKGSNFFFRSPK